MITLVVNKFVAPVMSIHGFRKAQFVWNREEAEIVHMLNIQKSQWNDKESVRITINLGVCVKRMWQIYWNKTFPRIIRDVDCFPCIRIGYLLSEGSLHKDVWWTIKEPNDIDLVGTELHSILKNKCIPFLDNLNSNNAVLTVVNDPILRRHPAELLYYAILKYFVGAHDEARQILTEMLENVKLKMWHDRVKQVSERLASLP